MAENVAKFRTTITKFIDKVKGFASPEQKKKLTKIEFKIDAAMSLNTRGTIGLFADGLFPYTREVFSDNEQFFLQNDFSEGDSELMVLQRDLKEWWPTFSADQKSYIQKQMKLLIMLACLAVKHEGIRQIVNEFRDPSNPLTF